MMCAPACQKQSVHDTLNLVRHYLEYALGYAKEMDKNKSVWHPNAVPGVSVSLSNETMRLIDTAMRELGRLKDGERYCDALSEEEIARLHGEYCYNRELEFRSKSSTGYDVKNIGLRTTKCTGCPYSSEVSCLLKFAMSAKKESKDES